MRTVDREKWRKVSRETVGEEGDNEESIQEDIRDRIQGDIVDSVDWTENHEETRREKFDFRNPSRIL